MQLEEYLALGVQLEQRGTATDGCSLVGWFVHKFWPQAEQACWSHDFARNELIPVKDQSENDNLFKDALKFLGVPRPMRFIMYTFTKAQGWTKDKFGFGMGMFITAIIFLTFVVIGFANANPEISNHGPVHFPMNPANANDEFEPVSATCTSGGVFPDGNGRAYGEVKCVFLSSIIPWADLSDAQSYSMSSNQTNFACELFAENTNAGNNQGRNVTQYNSDNWTALYFIEPVGGLFPNKIHMLLMCPDGVQQ